MLLFWFLAPQYYSFYSCWLRLFLERISASRVVVCVCLYTHMRTHFIHMIAWHNIPTTLYFFPTYYNPEIVSYRSIHLDLFLLYHVPSCSKCPVSSHWNILFYYPSLSSFAARKKKNHSMFPCIFISYLYNIFVSQWECISLVAYLDA